MNRVYLLPLLLLVCTTHAQVRRSSRNLKPLTPPTTTAPVAAESGRSSLGVTRPRQQEPIETITKVTFLGPESGWGVVKANAPYYSTEGKQLGVIPGGTLFKYSAVKHTARTSLLVSHLKREDNWQGPYLLNCTTIAGYEGDPEKVDPQIVENLMLYFKYSDQAAARRQELRAQAHAANPHAAAMQQAEANYRKSVQRAAELQKESTTASGAQRQKLLDELRTIKYEQSRLKGQLDQAMTPYQQWNRAHEPTLATIEADPELRKVVALMQAAARPVAQLLPPTTD